MQVQADSEETRRRVLRQTRLLADCDYPVIERLAAASHIERAQEGEVISLRGQQSTHFFVVTSGLVELSILTHDGKRHINNWISQGESYGLISALNFGPLIHTATAVKGSSVLKVPSVALRDALLAFPAFAMVVIGLISDHARRNYEDLAAHKLLALTSRLVRVLLDRLDVVGPGRIYVTQADLAAMVGVTRQSLNIELQRLEATGALKLGRGFIEVVDDARLRAIGRPNI